MSPRALLAVLLLAALPPAHAGGTLDAAVVVVHVEDRFGDCAFPAAGFCLFQVENPDAPGAATVDAWQRIDYVGVATDFSTLSGPLGEAWLLPDRELTVYGRDLHVANPVFPLATTTYNEVPPPSESHRLEMNEDEIALVYPGESGHEERYRVLVYHDEAEIQYDRFGPMTDRKDADTDYFVTDVNNLCAYETCASVVDAYAQSTPNVWFGLSVKDMQVATDPEELTPPGAAAAQANATPANFSALPPLRRDDAAEDDAPPAPAPPADDDAPRAVAPARAPRAGPEPETPVPVRVQSPPPRAPPVDRTTAVVAGVATATALLLALGFALYSRFNTRAEALRSETRDALLRLVRERPGVCVADAAEALGLSRNAVQHHVRVLERVGLVRVVEERNLRTLYPPGVQVQETPAWLRRNETCLAILRALAESPAGLSRDELHRRFAEVPERTRNHHLKRLLAVGAVVADESPEGVKTLRLPPQPPANGGSATRAGAA